MQACGLTSEQAGYGLRASCGAFSQESTLSGKVHTFSERETLSTLVPISKSLKQASRIARHTNQSLRGHLQQARPLFNLDELRVLLAKRPMDVEWLSCPGAELPHLGREFLRQVTYEWKQATCLTEFEQGSNY